MFVIADHLDLLVCVLVEAREPEVWRGDAQPVGQSVHGRQREARWTRQAHRHRCECRILFVVNFY
jgi:hypothetical protein